MSDEHLRQMARAAGKRANELAREVLQDSGTRVPAGRWLPTKYSWGLQCDGSGRVLYSETWDGVLGVTIRWPAINMLVETDEDARDLSLTIAIAAAREGL